MNNLLRKRYKITDSMWDEIEKWADGHNPDIKFKWEFQPVADFLEVIDKNTNARIVFADDNVQSVIAIPEDKSTVVVESKALSIEELLVEQKTIYISYYPEKKQEVDKLIAEVSLDIDQGRFNGKDSDDIVWTFKNSPLIINARSTYDNELDMIKLNN